MIAIRAYRPADAQRVGLLIADTYGQFNLSFLPLAQHGPFLGPFRHARSREGSHRQAIACVIHSEMVFVAESEDEILGVLRGRRERLASLFVRGDCHRRGIGRSLVARFEQASRERGVTVIRVASSLYAIPFYLKMGYKRSTGVRSGRSFEGRGLPVQPMRKHL